jgi:hypothetical protein
MPVVGGLPVQAGERRATHDNRRTSAFAALRTPLGRTDRAAAGEVIYGGDALIRPGIGQVLGVR